MKNILLFLSLFVFSFSLFSQDDVLNIVVIGAHPDDADVTYECPFEEMPSWPR